MLPLTKGNRIFNSQKNAENERQKTHKKQVGN